MTIETITDMKTRPGNTTKKKKMVRKIRLRQK